MVGKDKESTVASHSFNVAMLAMEIRKRMFNTPGIDEMTVCYFALIHDVKESYTGDIPTPTKTAMKAAGFDPDNYDDSHADEQTPIDRVKDIIKAADLVDNCIFIGEHGTGARARVAYAEVRGRLDSYLAGAPEDLRRATAETMNYVLNRSSDAVEERIRLAEDRETCSRVNSRLGFPLVVGRES